MVTAIIVGLIATPVLMFTAYCVGYWRGEEAASRAGYQVRRYFSGQALNPNRLPK